MDNQVPDFLKPVSPEQALQKYTINLTALANDGKLDPVIGRETEIRRVMEILSRRTKNNPIMIGDTGVGKTAIVEGLAENNINLYIADDLGIHFAEVGFDPVFGARPLRRAIEEQLVDEIASGIIEGSIKPGDTVKPIVENGIIVL